jgi:AraC family transcriptional regulator of arabinose operon
MGEPIPAGASFISSQVLNGEYYFLNLEPAPEITLCVVCGGRELCGAAYEIDRPGFRYHCIEYVASGSGTLVLGGTSFPLKPGSLFRYGPDVPHRIGVERGASMVKYFVDFAGQAARKLVSSSPWVQSRPLRVREPARLGALFEELQRVGRRPATHSERLCVLLLEQIVLLAADEAVPDEGAPSAAWATYQRCRGYIEKHGLRLRSLAEVAAECSVSEAHLCRLFHRYAATSPYQLLVRLKMARAAALLLNGRLLVRDVGRRIGYEDPYHFSKAFKRAYGLSPDAFRSRRRAGTDER